MPRRRDDELIELIDPAAGDDLYALPLVTSAPAGGAPPNRRRPIVAALVASAAVAGAGLWLQSTESSSAPSPTSAATTTPATAAPAATAPASALPRPPGQPPRYVGDAPAGMYLAGSRPFEVPGGDWSYAVWATPGATSTSGAWIVVQAWPGTLDDVALTDGWRHPAGDSEVITAFDSRAALWTAWGDGDPDDGVVLQTIAHGWNEAELLSLTGSLDINGGEITLGIIDVVFDLQLLQTGAVLRNDLLGGDGIIDTLVNPDDGSFLSVFVADTDAAQEQRFDVLARFLLRPTAKTVTGTGDVAVTYDTGDWFGRALTRFTDGEWTITIAGTVPSASVSRFVSSMAELTTASDGYGRVSSRYPPDALSSAYLPAGRDGTAEWRVVRSGEQLTWELRFGGGGSVYQQRMAVRGESGEMVTLHSLSGNGFTAVWASAPDDGRSLALQVMEPGGVTTEVPLRPIDSLFAGPVVAVHVFSEAHDFTATVMTDDGDIVADWPTRASAEE